MRAERESKVTGWMRFFIRVVAVLTVVAYFVLRRQRRLSGVTHCGGQPLSPSFAVPPIQEPTQPTPPTGEADSSPDESTEGQESEIAPSWTANGPSQHQTTLNAEALSSTGTEDRQVDSADALARLPNSEGSIAEGLEPSDVGAAGDLEVEPVIIASTEGNVLESQNLALHDNSELATEGPAAAEIVASTTAEVPEAPDQPPSLPSTEENTTIRAIPEWLLPDYDDDPRLDVESAEEISIQAEGSLDVGQRENSNLPGDPETYADPSDVDDQSSAETSGDYKATEDGVDEPIGEASDLTAANDFANDQGLGPPAPDSASAFGPSAQSPRRAFRQRMKRWLGRRYSTSDTDLIRRRLEVNNGLDLRSEAEQDDKVDSSSASNSDENPVEKPDSAKFDSDVTHIAQSGTEPTFIRLQRRGNRVEA